MNIDSAKHPPTRARIGCLPWNSLMLSYIMYYIQQKKRQYEEIMFSNVMGTEMWKKHTSWKKPPASLQGPVGII